MKAIGNLLAPLALIALPMGLAGCGDVPVEAQTTIERPASTVFAYLATAPAASAFGPSATLTVQEASANSVKGELTVGEKTAPVEFAITPAGAGVTVTAKSKKGRFGGEDLQPALEAGLAALQTEATAFGAFDFGDLKFEVTEIAPRPFLYIEASTPNDAASIKSGVLQAMTIVDAQMRANGLVPDGDPTAIETEWNEQTQRYGFQAGRPYRGAPPTLLIAVRSGQTPGGTAIRVPYEGPEDAVIPTYDRIETMIAAARLTKVGGSFEVYKDDPTQVGGSVRREIYHVVSGDAQRLANLFPNNRAAPLDSTAPSTVGTVAGAAPPAATTEAVAPAPAPAPAAPMTPATTP